jgi:hypothetical protein
MARLLLITIAAFVAHLGRCYSQCPEPLIFYSQEELDGYFNSHPECTELGTLEIWNNGSIEGQSTITNFDALSNVVSIDSLIVLNYIGSSLDIGGLQNLTQLNSLNTMQLNDFSFCSNIQHMDYIHLEFHDEINFYNLDIDLSGFDNLISATSINLGFSIEEGTFTNIFPNLTALSVLNFEPYWYNLTYTTQFNILDGFHAIDHLDFAYVGSLNIFLCNHLSICNSVITISHLDYIGTIINFDSFQNAVEIDYLQIFLDPEQSIDFPALQHASTLYIHNSSNSTCSCPLLATAGLVEISYTLGYLPNETIIVDLPQLHTVDNFYLQGYLGTIQNAVYDIEISALDSVLQDFGIHYTHLTDLTPFIHLDYIGGDIHIANNFQLSNCSIDAVCENLNVNPDHVIISNNTGNCIDNVTAALACNMPDPYISGLVFMDFNCNAIFDGNDTPFPHPLFLDNSGEVIGMSGTSGIYIIQNFTGGLLDVAPQNAIGFQPVNVFQINTDTLTEALTAIDFALCPDPDYNDVSISLQQWPMRPGFINLTELLVQNNSTNPESVTIYLEHSLFASLSNWSSNNDFTIDGNQIHFAPIDLIPFETRAIVIESQLLASIGIGTEYVIHSSISTTSNDQLPANNNSIFNGTVVGSYDPNDIQVNLPLIDVEQVDPAGDWLTYRIRFQNTGNFPAEFVHVVSVQDELVDMGTIQMIDASHDNSWSFDGREVTWFFDNIQLPDSLSDPEGSQGYIIYKVRTQPSLGVGDVLDVNAAIYFDFNEPVITNTTTTEYYLCPEELTLQTNDATICEYDIAALSASSGYETYTWSFNDQILSTAQSLNYAAIAPGNYTISCLAVATPDVCQSETSINIEVIAEPETPTITQEENTLTASGTGTFVWSLNGEVLNGSTNVLEMTETGTYSVYIDGDCPSGIATGFYTYTGIDEDEMLDVVVYPNPAQQWLRVEAPFIAGLLVIRDMLGRKIYEHPLNTTLSIDLENWPNGAYVVAITTEAGIITRSFVKQ